MLKTRILQMKISKMKTLNLIEHENDKKENIKHEAEAPKLTSEK